MSVNPEDSVSQHRPGSQWSRRQTTVTAASWLTSSSKTSQSNKSKILREATEFSFQELSLQLTVVLLPLAIIIGLSALALYQVKSASDEASAMYETVLDTMKIKELLTAIEHEQEYMCDYVIANLENKNKLLAAEMLRQAEATTDAALEHVKPRWSSDYGSITAFEEKLQKVRNGATNAASCPDALAFYTPLAHPLTMAIVHHLGNTEEAQICQLLSSFQTFLLAQEHLGQAHATGNGYFAGKSLTTEELAEFQMDHGAADKLFEVSLDTVIIEGKQTQAWRIVLEEEYPEVSHNWNRLYTAITFQNTTRNTHADKEFFSQQNWQHVTKQMGDFFQNLEHKIRVEADRLIFARVDFFENEALIVELVVAFGCIVCPVVAIIYAVFVRNQRLKVVGVASRVKEQSKAIESEQHKVTQLLNQLLPKHVVDALRTGTTVAPETYQSVTILFSDVIGFGTMANNATAAQTVAVLNDLYGGVEQIQELHNCYKVETVNDCIVISSGVPYRNGSAHSNEIAAVALDMLMMITQTELPHLPGEHPLLRIGIHTGHCTSGVVGNAKPKFCLFGDAVNTSSRMMSNSNPMCIHVSHDTYEHLNRHAPGYTFEPRGESMIKGKGKMLTYWLLSREGHPYVVDLKAAARTAQMSSYDKVRRPSMDSLIQHPNSMQ